MSDPEIHWPRRWKTTLTWCNSSSVIPKLEEAAAREGCPFVAALAHSALRACALSDQRGIGQQPHPHPIAQDSSGTPVMLP